MANFVKGDKKLLNAWAFYDWANSFYALVISSSIFPLYYGALFR
jgi:UMF1 family MFS transporter